VVKVLKPLISYYYFKEIVKYVKYPLYYHLVILH